MNDTSLYSFGFACQDVKTKCKTGIRFQETFKAACRAETFFTSKTDYFLSLYTFNSDIVEYFKESGNSTAGYSGACWSPFLWFDIDRNDLETAQTDAARLVEFLCQTSDCSDSGLIVPNTESILIFFSGSKGFHVGVPIAVFGDSVKSGKDYPLQYKRLALEISRRAGVEIDKSIYDRVRLFRCPNSKHSKTGLYKIPLSYCELAAYKSIDDIRARASCPRRLVWVESELDKINIDDVRYSSAVKPVPGAVQTWTEAQTDTFSELPSIVQAIKEDTGKPEAVSQYEACINRFPDGSEVPRLRRDTLDFIQRGAERGERAERLYKAVCDCLRCGWNRQAVESVFYDVAAQTGLYWQEVKHQITGAFRSIEQEKGGLQ